MALGAALAIEAAGLQPGEDILIVGIDGQIEAFEAVQAGTMSATVFSSPYYGPAVFDVIDALVAGEDVETEVVLPGFVVDAKNVADEIHQAY
jgi:ribose transport system substrate-binding protein